MAAAATLLPGRAAAAEAPAIALPPLPYAFDALEPHFDAKTMEIHHGKHHAAYIAGLTTALASAPDLAAKKLETLLAELPAVGDEKLRAPLRNHGGGHWNHTFFWETLAPAAKSGQPSEALAVAIQSAFGSMDNFKKAFGEAATKRFGSGWAWLIVKDGKLAITSTPNQDNPLMDVAEVRGTPILGLDVWEHAYYLKYQYKRGDYIGAWWDVVNWTEVSRRYAEATAA
ncbi:MAG: superoxide dismutase, partial [Akkermansiaceae bacterium]|nr:superoxide dismutase [Akkermansiaceae bacterium]